MSSTVRGTPAAGATTDWRSTWAVSAGVNTEGAIVRASAEENPELLLALQAGETGSGVITSLALQRH